MKNPQEHCINVCNGLLRGELSAVETYTQAIDKHGSNPAVGELRRIRTEHSRSAHRLSDHIRELGGQPDNGSGTWGTFASAVQAAANLFGPGSAVDSLRRGEEAGRGHYQDALLDDDVMVECKTIIREYLLPRVIHHISTLEALEMELHGAAR